MDLEKPLKFVGFVGESVCAPFCAPLKNKNAVAKFKRKPCQQTNENKHSSNTTHHQKSINNALKWLPGGGVGGSRGGLGSSWAPDRRQEAPEISFGDLRVPKKRAREAPGPPQRRKVDRFQGPRGVPGGSGEGSGEVFWVLFLVTRRGGPKNKQK